MSLNIDLYAVTHRDGHERATPEQRETFAKILDLVGLAPFNPVDSIPYLAVNIHVADCNHACQISRWFTDHLEDGESSEEEVPVNRETLRQLLDTCNKILVRRNRKEAEAMLPLPHDLFEDKAEARAYWRETYWHHVEETVRQLDPILNNPKFTAQWEFRGQFGG